MENNARQKIKKKKKKKRFTPSYFCGFYDSLVLYSLSSLTLYAPIQQNGQIRRKHLIVFDHFVGLGLKGYIATT